MKPRIKIKLRRLTEGKQLLNEVSLEKAKESLDSKKLLKAIRQYAINYAQADPWEWKSVWDDEGENILPDQLDLMVSTMHDSLKGWIWDMIPEDIETDRTRRDKSNQALALLWLLRLIRTQPRMMKKVVHDYAEDSEKIMEDFEMYFNYKHLMEKPDLNSIGSIDELEQVVLDARDDIRDYQEKQSYANVEEGTEVFRDDEDWMIAALHNKGAACELGKGTDWCTAAPGLDYFAEYYEEDDPLFFFKQKRYMGDMDKGYRENNRFQFHYGSGQFMDEDDNQVPSHLALHLHNRLMETEAPAKYPIIRKHDIKLKISHDGTHPELLNDFIDNPDISYSDLQGIAKHPNASEETLRKLIYKDIRAKDYMAPTSMAYSGPNTYSVNLKATIAQREVSPELLKELWEKTWKDYQENLEMTEEKLRNSKHNETNPNWYAEVSPRQFERIRELFMPAWQKIAWNPAVATLTLEEIIEKAQPTTLTLEMIKQKIMAREAGEEELGVRELRRRAIAARHPKSSIGVADRESQPLQESKVFSRWQKIIN